MVAIIWGGDNGSFFVPFGVLTFWRPFARFLFYRKQEWRDRFDEFPYDSLFKSHWYLLPCSACVDVATQFLWEGEKEFRDAVPVLEQQLKELGISHLQPCAWRITPEKDEIAVIFFEDRVYEFLLVLSDGEWVPKEV